MMREVSIHAPARGATRSALHSTLYGPVSIHAPARGATSGGNATVPFVFGFNPRAREGRDASSLAARISLNSFNPRAREGRDRHVRTMKPTSSSFNPRAREGRDFFYAYGPGQPGQVSIHAPARGATSTPAT